VNIEYILGQGIMDGYEHGARLAKAVGHPIRMQILEVLQREGESCVCHLEHRLGAQQAKISQQLARLRDAGLVDDRREGLNVFYALKHAGVEPLLRALREAASASAQLDGRQLVFDTLRGDSTNPCPCPRCCPEEA
jgi:ArsR family transcriptional regulator